MKLDYEDERTPVARVIARRPDGKIIILRKKELGKWELPGGKIEEGETRFEASKRELQSFNVRALASPVPDLDAAVFASVH